MKTAVTSQTGHTLWRGPRPASEQDYVSLRCPLIINLEEGFFEFFHGEVHEEACWAARNGITFLHHALSDFTAPRVADVGLIISALKAGLQTADVYLHCLHGEDRTGFICAVWRMTEQDWTFDQAAAEMYSLGYHKIPYLLWIPELKKYASK